MCAHPQGQLASMILLVWVQSTIQSMNVGTPREAACWTDIARMQINPMRNMNLGTPTKGNFLDLFVRVRVERTAIHNRLYYHRSKLLAWCRYHIAHCSPNAVKLILCEIQQCLFNSTTTTHWRPRHLSSIATQLQHISSWPQRLWKCYHITAQW